MPWIIYSSCGGVDLGCPVCGQNVWYCWKTPGENCSQGHDECPYEDKCDC